MADCNLREVPMTTMARGDRIQVFLLVTFLHKIFPYAYFFVMTKHQDKYLFVSRRLCLKYHELSIETR